LCCQNVAKETKKCTNIGPFAQEHVPRACYRSIHWPQDSTIGAGHHHWYDPAHFVSVGMQSPICSAGGGVIALNDANLRTLVMSPVDSFMVRCRCVNFHARYA
jgi:hypothetical protein